MSTRANVIIRETWSYEDEGEIVQRKDELIFYRHSDGYPEGTIPSLKKFINLTKTHIRRDLSQGAGWLIVIGLFEYRLNYRGEETHPGLFDCKHFEDLTPGDWKVGAYEPTTCIHGDIEFLYVVDLTAQTIKCYKGKEEGVNEIFLIKFNLEKTLQVASPK